MRARRTRICLAALVLVAGDARANGRFPAADMLVAQPGNDARLAVRTTFGLLTSSDQGATWGWICEMAPGYRGGADPSIALTAGGSLLVATSTGVRRSSDLGCHWETGATAPGNVRDFTVRPGTPGRIYAITERDDWTDGGNPHHDSSLLISEDDGASWTNRSRFDTTVSLDAIEVAPSDPSRVYASGTRHLAPHRSAGVLLTSSDDGASWVEHRFDLAPDEHGFFIAAVDPRNGKRVYLRSGGVDHNSLLVTDDAGASMRVLLDRVRLAGFALADGGETIYAGGPGTGILRARASNGSFEKRSDFAATCLLAHGPTLWACSLVGRGSLLSTSGDDGATFQPRLTTNDLGILACSDSQLGAACAREWADLPKTLPWSVLPTSDSGPGEAAAPKRSSACGCSEAGAANERNRAGLALLLALLGGAVVLRRRDRRIHTVTTVRGKG